MTFQLKTIKILSLFLICFFTNSCYDDGPLISFRSAESRVDGTYDVEKFEVSGTDSTIAYKSKPCYHPVRFRYNKEKNPQGSISRWQNGNACITDGEWYVRGNNIHLHFKGNYAALGPWGGNYEADWEIKELENENMTFEIKSNNILYKITLNEL